MLELQCWFTSKMILMLNIVNGFDSVHINRQFTSKITLKPNIVNESYYVHIKTIRYKLQC